MKPIVMVVALLFGWVPFAGPALADTYTWVDKDGTVHFQDEPPGNGIAAKRLQSFPEEPPRAEPRAGETTPPGDAAVPKAAPPPKESVSERPRVKPKRVPVVDLYTTGWCPWCKKAREYFNARGIPFTEHDIEKDAGAQARKFGLDRDKRVPTVVIDGRLVRGFSPAGYQAALEQR